MSSVKPNLKLRTVQLRVSEVLEQFLKQQSDREGKTVSEYSRTVLEGAVRDPAMLDKSLNASVSVTKALMQDEQYYVELTVSGSSMPLAEDVISCLLPDYDKGDSEPARIISLSGYADIFPQCRNARGRNLGARIKNGVWKGFIFLLDESLTAAARKDHLDRARNDLRRMAEQAVSEHLRIRKETFSVNERGEVEQGTFFNKPGCKIILSQPEGYDYGAWKVEIEFTPEARKEYEKSSPVFCFPKIAQRLFVAQKPYDGIYTDPESQDMEVGFRFIDGRMICHVYSNGVPEEENNSFISEVIDSLYLKLEAVTDWVQL
ncbi:MULTISPECIES: hypothetical protein [Pantoea]|uniref:hypothetical protein n=1 Tax=Pantoea TaxID=53335 RepID=UPI00077AD5F0|nr:MULTISPECIES: hypothetical protein [Pantoea]WNK56300.1 hypothetical protein RM154_24035 [Pantoea agglomerans]